MTLAIPTRCLPGLWAGASVLSFGTATIPDPSSEGTATSYGEVSVLGRTREPVLAKGPTKGEDSLHAHMNLIFGNTSKPLDSDRAVSVVRAALDYWLDELAALEPNWNGYGAERIHPENIEVARELVGLFPADGTGTPRVVPMTHGRLQFEWDVRQRSLEIEITSPGLIRFLKWDPSAGIEEEGEVVPSDHDAIRSLIGWIANG